MEKRSLVKILIILACFATAFAGANIDIFQATVSGDNTTLDWHTTDESNVQYFIIQRKTPQTDFVDVAKISPDGSHYYKYIDQSIYKTNDVMLIYQIGVLYYNNPTPEYLKQTSVSMSISGIRKTWGSIKAMFR
ncbi:MAG: hypothetical protein M1480_11255 [Bacteroidetes bacterium]|nr:hypothetical protein [Bacteroidota bacterium]